MRGHAILGLLLVVALAACEPGRVFENHRSVGPQWSWEEPARFEVDIRDTLSRYDLYVNVRHELRYGYANLWVQIRTAFPGGDTVTSRVEVPLAEPDGTWLGECTGRLCFRRDLIGAQRQFPRSGVYVFEILQDMREEDLPGIRDVGIRIEKVRPTTP